MPYFKKLVGKNIYLSPMAVEDAEIWAKWKNDIHNFAYVHHSPNINLESAIQNLKDSMSENNHVFSVLSHEDRLIGHCALFDFHQKNHNAQLGILIGESDAQGKGYGTEAVMLLLDYGFNVMNLHQVYLAVVSHNTRAIRCYEKCGFVKTGVRRKSQHFAGEWHDLIHMDILREEFTQSPYIIPKFREM